MKFEKIGFFGAGFSKWCIDIPLMKDLFDFKGHFWEREKKGINKLKVTYNSWKQNNKAKTNEHFINNILTSQNKKVDSKLLIFYICRRLSEPFIWYEKHVLRTRRHTYNLQGSGKKRIPFINRPGDWLSSLDALLTTNYDLILEYLIGPKGYNYGYQGETLSGRGSYPVSQYQKPVVLSGQIPLMKLHGSLSWTLKGHHTDGRGGLTGEAIIIPPIFEKIPSKRFQKIWENAEKILNNAEKILFFGFAFNPYDDAILNLLTENISNTAKIIIVNPSPNKNRIENLFNKCDIDYINPLNKDEPTLNKEIEDFFEP